MMTSMLDYKQINLQHSKSASYELKRLLAVSHTNFCLIQEPYLINGAVAGLDSKFGRIFLKSTVLKTRACIYISNDIDAALINECSTADLAAVLITLVYADSRFKLVIASAYLPYDSTSPPPSEELMNLVVWCRVNNLPLVIGCDANAHHTIWGSSNTNSRGSSLLNYIYSSELEILNVGCEPTFINSVRKEVIDISLCSMTIVDLILNWRVTDDILTSDHRCISFNINFKRPPVKPYRNRKLTNWDSFSSELVSLLDLPKQIRSISDLDLQATALTKAISTAFEKSCPLIYNQKKLNKPFWCSELKKLRKSVRKIKNKAKNTNLISDWNRFLVAQKAYKKSLRSAQRAAWKNFCEEIDNLSVLARLNKTLAKNDTCKLDSLRLPSGKLTSCRREVGELLLSVHFPGCDSVDSSVVASEPPDIFVGTPDWNLARRLITTDVLHWSVFSFAPFKSSGPDGVFPAELQHGFLPIRTHLLNLFQACIAFSTVPRSWSRSRVVFIPKAGKSDYTDPKAFRPISLTSTFLKALERIIDRFIRDNYLTTSPLSNMQHAYRAGKSCETALHELVTRIERSLNYKEFLVGTFLDIAGAFDSTSFSSITSACTNFNINQTIVRFIDSMLKSRIIETELDGSSVSVKVAKGCPQGGVLSPLLWLMVIDELLVKLQRSGFIVQSYADDLVLTVSGKYLNVLSDLMQNALNIVEVWCVEKGLHVNPSKTDLVVFSRRRDSAKFSVPILFGRAITRTEHVKHLGVILDSKLSWKFHLDHKLQKAIAIFWQCRRAFGNSWGLTPRMMLFIYKSLVLPLLSYAAVVWWPVVKLTSSVARLDGLQMTACRAITGAMSSTPLLAMESILCLPELQSYILGVACSAAFRLRCIGAWNTFGTCTGHRQILNKFKSHIPEVEMVNDRLLPEFNFTNSFSVVFPSRELWLSQDFYRQLSESIVFFTDGSRSEVSAGFGFFCPKYGLRFSGSLGKHCTVFQAELIALTHSAIEAFKFSNLGKDIIICTDSKAVLNTLKNPLTTSKLVKECKHFINRLCSNSRVKVMWVPAHCDVVGNEVADLLAKAGSRSKFCGPEPAIPLSFNGGKDAIKKFALLELAQKWRSTPSCRKAKRFIIEPNVRVTKYVLSLKKSQLRILVALITGHGRFKVHLQRMGLAQDDLCDDCLEEVDDCLHYLCSCPAFVEARSLVFSHGSLNVDQLLSISWFKLLQFAKAAVRLCELG